MHIQENPNSFHYAIRHIKLNCTKPQHIWSCDYGHTHSRIVAVWLEYMEGYDKAPTVWGRALFVQHFLQENKIQIDHFLHKRRKVQL